MTDVEPAAPNDPARQGGLKDQKDRPTPENDSVEVDVEAGEVEDRREEGGMIGEG